MDNRFLRILARQAIPVCQRLLHPALAGLPRKLGRVLGLDPLPPRYLVLRTGEWASRPVKDGRDYCELAPAQPVHRRLPVSLEPTPDWRIRRDIGIVNPSLFVSTLPNGRVVGPSGAVITADDTLLADLSPDWFFKPDQHPLFWRFKLPAIRTLKGAYASLARLSGWNYAHWVLELLPRLAILEKAGVDWRRLNGLILNGPPCDWKSEMLDLLEIPETQRIYLEAGDHVQCDTLLVPSYVCAPHGYPAWMVEFMQKKFMAPECNRTKASRIYIARGKAAYRRVVNEPEVVRLLEHHGFQSTYCEDLSFRQKAELFASADAVVAAHGAGLTHLVFCQPHTRVLEMFSPDYVNGSFWALSDAAGLDYYYLTTAGTVPPEGRDPHSAEKDLVVDLSVLEKALKQFGFE